jgi:hypothetical protein
MRDGRVDDEMRRRMRLIVPHMRRAVLIGRVISTVARGHLKQSDLHPPNGGRISSNCTLRYGAWAAERSFGFVEPVGGTQ